MFIWGFVKWVTLQWFDLPITIPYTEWGTLLGEEELSATCNWGWP